MGLLDWFRRRAGARDEPADPGRLTTPNEAAVPNESGVEAATTANPAGPAGQPGDTPAEGRERPT